MLSSISPAETVAGDPFVFADSNAEMAARITAELDEMNAGSAAGKHIIGIVVTEDGPLPIVAGSPNFTSRRKLADTDEADQRVMQATYVTHYAATEYERFHSLGPNSGVQRIIDSNTVLITGPDNDTNQIVFQSSPPSDPRLTRSGFLGKIRDDVTSPMTTLYKGQRYAVEIKGCGSAAGSFDTFRDKFFNRVVIGGLSLADAQKEVRNMQRAHEAGLTPLIPLAIGELALSTEAETEYGKLGIVFRLTPSTIRLSYGDIPGSPVPQNRNEALVVASKLAGNFLDKFFLPDEAPIFLSPASHLENYIVEHDGRISETDFEDFRELGTKEFPFVHTQSASFIDARKTVQHYFVNIGRLDHFDPVADHTVLAATINQKLTEKGIELDLSTCASVKDIANHLWDEWLVGVAHEQRVKGGYRPVDMIDFFRQNFAGIADIVASADEEQDRQAFVDLAQAFRDDLDGIAKFARFANTLYITGHVYQSGDYSNRERFSGFMRVLEARHEEKLKLDTQPAAPVIHSALSATNTQHEMAVRIFGGLSFFEEWVRSEVHDYKLLVDSGNEDCTNILGQLSTIQAHVREVMDSHDVKYAEFFVQRCLKQYIAIIDALYGAQYG